MSTPLLEIDTLLTQMGAAGQQLDRLGAVEASAGNISCVVKPELDLSSLPHPETINLPGAAPALAGYTVLVSGSGCRLRDIAAAPEATVAVITIHDDGATGTLWYSDQRGFQRPTSEFNSHLAVHHDHVARRGVSFHALVHSQPPYVVTLSHIPAIASTEAFNRRILRWEPETIIQLPEGVGFLPFAVPGSQQMMEENLEGLRHHQVVIWAKHGLMARSDESVLKATDKIEYVETGAMYEYRNLAISGIAEGLTDAELHDVVRGFDVPTRLY